MSNWTYDESQKDNAEFLRQFINFLQSSNAKTPGDRPQFVPCTVRVPNTIRSEAPQIFTGVIEPGVHHVHSNQWGAISAIDSNKQLLGIRPTECVVLAMTKNPHL